MIFKNEETDGIFDAIQDSSSLLVSGFNLANTPEFLILGLYDHFKKTGHPKDLFLMSDALPATPGRALDKVLKDVYENNEKDFLKGVLIPFLGFSPWLQRITLENFTRVYSWPIGTMAYWIRETASGRPGLLTKIGIDTFLDPRREQGCLNDFASDEQICTVSLMRINDEEYLFYQAPKPDWSFIRGTVADRYGNISLSKEPIKGTVMEIAQCTKASGRNGKVVAQVLEFMEEGRLPPKDVDVPWPFVDFVVKSPSKFHWQTSSFEFDESTCPGFVPVDEKNNQMRLGSSDIATRIIVGRAQEEIENMLKAKKDHILINIGVGIPTGLSEKIREKNLGNKIVTMLESGPWGGEALAGSDFGVARNYFALSSIPDMFSNYESGIVDVAALGFLQVDRSGNVNSSILPDRITGPGGFPVISGGSPTTMFMGKFMAGKSDFSVQNGNLKINLEGKTIKFVYKAYRVLFSGKQGYQERKRILYITERAVFRLSENGIELIEVAPGIDLKKDILQRMEFTPAISQDLKEMDLNKYIGPE